MCRLSLVGVSVGCSLLRLSSLWITGSRCTGLAAHGMWDLPGPGFEPVSPALAGGFSTTDPAGKSLILFYVVLLLLVRGQRLTFPGAWTCLASRASREFQTPSSTCRESTALLMKLFQSTAAPSLPVSHPFVLLSCAFEDTSVTVRVATKHIVQTRAFLRQRQSIANNSAGIPGVNYDCLG